MQATITLSPRILRATLGKRRPEVDQHKWQCSCCPCLSESAGSCSCRYTDPRNSNRTRAFTALPAVKQRFRSGRSIDCDPKLPAFQLIGLAELFQIAEVRHLQRFVHLIFCVHHVRLAFQSFNEFPITAISQQSEHLSQQRFPLVCTSGALSLCHLLHKLGEDLCRLIDNRAMDGLMTATCSTYQRSSRAYTNSFCTDNALTQLPLPIPLFFCQCRLSDPSCRVAQLYPGSYLSGVCLVKKNGDISLNFSHSSSGISMSTSAAPNYAPALRRSFKVDAATAQFR